MQGYEPSAPLAICTGCVAMLANGECGDCYNERQHPCPTGKRLARRWGDVHITLGCLGDCCESETEPWFSWSDCDGCGSTLGGDREHATAWFPIRPDVIRKRWHRPGAYYTVSVENARSRPVRTIWVMRGKSCLAHFTGAGRYAQLAEWKRKRIPA